MSPSLTDTLCTRCGLCRDGSLFADVELTGPAEATGLEILGLAIDDDADGGLLLLPCAALDVRDLLRAALVRELPQRLLLISGAHDVVAIKHGSGLVPRTRSNCSRG